MRTVTLVILTCLIVHCAFAQADTSVAAKRSRFSFVVDTRPQQDTTAVDSVLLADILSAIRAGRITAFADSECLKPLPVADVNAVAAMPYAEDTTQYEDTATGEWVITYVRRDFDYYWLHHFRFVAQSKPAVQLISVGVDRESSSTFHRQGYQLLKPYEPTRTMFWLRYSDIKPLFDHYIEQRPGHKLHTELKNIKIPVGGFLAYPDGRKYRGRIVNDRPDGKGVMYYADGDCHLGYWTGGVRNGAGMYYFFGGDSVKGSWRNDKLNGNGIYYFSNGNKYVGNFVNGKFTGKGIKYYGSGNRYDGNWSDDKPNGKGTYYFSNSERYVGSFVNGKFEGKGIYYFENGDRYEGDFKNDQKNGQGIFYWADGSRYNGAWKDGLMEGLGVYSVGNRQLDELTNCPDCVLYKGMWKNDEKTGQGRCYDKDGRLLYEGEYANDRPLGKYLGR